MFAQELSTWRASIIRRPLICGGDHRKPLDKHKSDLRLPYIAAMVRQRLRARSTRRAAACYMFNSMLGKEAAGKLSSDIHTFIQFLSLHLSGDETGHIYSSGQFARAI